MVAGSVAVCMYTVAGYMFADEVATVTNAMPEEYRPSDHKFLAVALKAVN